MTFLLAIKNEERIHTGRQGKDTCDIIQLGSPLGGARIDEDIVGYPRVFVGFTMLPKILRREEAQRKELSWRLPRDIVQ